MSTSFVDAKEPPKKDKDEQEPREIKVRIGVFFDGTNNNRYQVMLGRLAREKENKATPEEIQENNEILEGMELKKLSGAEQWMLKKTKDKAHTKRVIFQHQSRRWIGLPQGSMQSVGFSNIAILERFYKPTDQNDRTYKIYITGPGTSEDLSKGISPAGQATGQGAEGVVKKIWDAMDSIALRTKDINSDPSISGVHYVFDVFGFSRGATESRLFVDVCCSRGGRLSVFQEGIKKYNKIFSNNNNSSEDKIQFPKQKDIKFNVGVFDTVASVGVIRNSQWVSSKIAEPVQGVVELLSNTSTYHDQNVKDLGLNTVAHDGTVEKVVHICALDEYRENFGLCALPDGGKVKQIFMPGTHSDIGGSTLPGYDEVSIPISLMKKPSLMNMIDDSLSYNYLLGSPEDNLARTISRMQKWFWIPRVAPLKQEVQMTIENLKRLGWLKDATNTPAGLQSDIFDDNDSVENVKVKRYSVETYSNLPLAIMAEQHNIVFEATQVKGKHAIPAKLPKSYGEMGSLWQSCSSNFGQCFFPEEASYKDLRKRHLHFSASGGLIGSAVNGPHYNEQYRYERILYTESGQQSLKG